MPHFDVLWSTSAYEGQSNAILEAMAAGVPVVATDIAGTRDLVVHEKTGLLISTRASDARLRRASFARHTKTLLDDPDLARRLGEGGRQRALGEFSVEKMARLYTDLYRRELA
jgi:glycosyltransferase involved in cell wall biosynthesis